MKSLKKLVFGALLVGVTGTLIYAAPGDGTSADDDTLTTSAAKTASMSPAEMSVNADSMSSAMNAALRHVSQLRAKAEAEKDIIKLNCVNDKLVPLKGQVNLGDTARRQLSSAIEAQSEPERYAAYSDLTVVNDRVRDLRDQADACVGDTLTYVGNTDVTVTGPENPLVPPDLGISSTIEPPAYRTPFD